MQKWSIGRKLGAGFGGLVACLLALGLASLWAENSLHQDLEEMSGKILRTSELSGSIETASKALRAEVRGIVLAASLKRPQDLQKGRSTAEQLFTQLESYTAEIGPLLAEEKAKAAVATIATTAPQWRGSARQMADLAAAGKIDPANQIRLGQQVVLANQIEESSATIRAIQREVAEAKIKEANQRAASNRWLILAMIAAGLALGALIFAMVRKLVGMLRDTVKNLSTGGQQVAVASGEIAATSQALAQGSSEQAASVEEISASMEEMTAMTKRTADHSTEASSRMKETAKQVERSNSALADMVESMSSIRVSSEKVAKINKIVDEIAFQTNLLALNAAVEAARAGEAGMGFAVVAGEVRNLAQRSADAAKDIAALIEESLVNANQGRERLALVSAAVRAITDGTGNVKNLLDEVNESSKQQGQGIQEVSTAISQVSVVTQNAAATAEKSAAASQELNAQSAAMRNLVDSLTAMVEGHSATT
jgi:methyl-accepting chemotaxis protein